MARMPEAEWRGPLPSNNWSTSFNSAIGVIVHHMDGSFTSADNWFRSPNNPGSSAHFGVKLDGSIVQWVDTAFVAYAQCQGNWQGYVSVETESDPNRPNDPPNLAQIAAIGRIIKWVGCDIRMAQFQGDHAVGYHRLFPGPCNQAWGQTSCPGDGFVAAMPAILDAARGVTPPPPPVSEKDEVMYIIANPAHPADKYLVGVAGARHIGTTAEYNILKAPANYGGLAVVELPPAVVTQSWFDSLPQVV